MIYSYHTKNIPGKSIRADSLMTPLLYGYNAVDANVKTCIGDMPMLVQRERFANSLTLDQCKAIFQECIEEWSGKGNFGFNPMVKHHDVFMKPRVAYIVEVLRQLAVVSADQGTVAVVDHDMLPFIEDAWQKSLPKTMRSLESMLKAPTPKSKDPLKQETFLEFVEKQVILDVIFEPFLEECYLQYEKFPFDPSGFLGKETAILNVYTFWKHYQGKYMD